MEKQIRGLIVIVIILAIIPFVIFCSNIFFNYKIPILATLYTNFLAVEIVEKDIDSGIYFTAPGTTVNQLLARTGIDIRSEKDFMLEQGMKLAIDSGSGRGMSLTAIDNSRRLALGIPIDLNLAGKDDLLLIPGIGEITAQKILKLRSQKGSFNNIEELMETEGIKEKKLSKLKRYLYLQK